MAFIRIPGFDALVFVPEDDPRAAKKHPCADCYSCKWCDEERCALCFKKKNGECAGKDGGGCK
ncbi:MAG: hypothetical protein EPN93_07355 [Spirochaetes bacterium]|nr:MAG: hypothetical protein EPN93_07355 [Spirochaetota bacterium]